MVGISVAYVLFQYRFIVQIKKLINCYITANLQTVIDDILI